MLEKEWRKFGEVRDWTNWIFEKSRHN